MVEKLVENLVKGLEPSFLRLARIEALLEREQAWLRAYR